MSSENSEDDEPPALLSTEDVIHLEDLELAKVPITIVTGYLGAGSSYFSL
jgi:hypothetical protein